MLRKATVALLVAIFAATSTPSFAAIDRSTLSTVKEGTTTSQEIKTKYGAPDHENHNPDGRYVYLYQIASPPPEMAGPSGQAVASFLFGKDDKLIRISFFKM